MRPAPALLTLLPLLALAVAGCASPAPGGAPTDPPRAAREAIEFATEAGPITVMLYPESAPQTVELMRQYVREGYYVGRSFGRVVPGHVIQVVDQAGGATDDGRRVPLEASPRFHFSAGAAGIARGAEPDSGGPELFIMDYATSHLDGNFTVWGQVVAGMDAVRDIARSPAVERPGAPAGPLVNDYLPFDRMAVDPVRITATRLVQVEVDAAAYPLGVAQNVRGESFRHSLDHRADLAPARANPVTWYVRPLAGAGAEPPATLTVTDPDGNVTMAAGASPGIYPFTWTPDRPGPHRLTAWHGSTALATLVVEVPAAPSLQG